MVGETTIFGVEKLPGIHEYVVAPAAESVAFTPGHIVTLLLAVTVGDGTTEKHVETVPMQPAAEVPVTV